MDDKEQQIIQLALAKGLVSEHDLMLISENKDPLTTTQSKVEGLMEAGLLSKAMWRALEQELEARKKSPSFKLPLTLEQDLLAIKAEKKPLTVDSFGRTMKTNSTISREIAENPMDLIKAGRYDLIKLLGEGGMGSVFLAYDPDLQRYVALKFLHSGDKEATQRLLQEGRAQAKIEHPNVCRVYEVSKFNGRIYIVMQYIDGEILPKLTKQLTLEQKIKVMADVAEGLHAAHKLGLIHRDVKPQNIIVEKTEDGDWKPYVMDFGLVREVSQKGMTMTGEILGTPYYMSPEQARGRTELLDRRSDVYSLGATLYELLSGKLPQEGIDLVDLLRQIATEEVTPIRKISPQIPVDVETIIMKALEKEPQRRYDSAKALAEDLRRYLAGEPIEAKQANIFYKLQRLAIKHKVIVIPTAIVLLVIIVALIRIQFEKDQTRRSNDLNRKFGAQVEKIEHMMRHTHMLPLHDINGEKQLIESQIDELRENIEEQGAKEDAIGYYALGRVCQETGRYEDARKNLEIAWQKGYQGPEVAYYLGVLLNEFYRKKLSEVQQLLDHDSQEIEHQKLTELGKEAQNYLMKSKGVVSQSEYGEALMAFYEKNLDLALSKSELAVKKIPWLYEAKRLTGDIYFEIGNEKHLKKDFQAAKQSYLMARNAYEEALRIAPSDPETYNRLIELWSRVLVTDYNNGDDIKESAEQILKITDLSLKTDRTSTYSYIKRTYAYLYLGIYQARKLKEDPTVNYQNAISEAERGIKNIEAFTNMYNLMGVIYKLKGEYILEMGKDPSQDFEKSISSYNEALEIDKNYLPTYFNLSNVSSLKAQYQIKQGQDPKESLENAINSCQKAIQINPTVFSLYSKLVLVYAIETQYLLNIGEDPSSVVEKAVQNFNKVVEIYPQDIITYNYLGFGYINQGEYLLEVGRDPNSIYDKAIEKFQHTLLTTPTYDIANYGNIASAYFSKGYYQLLQGQSPMSLADKAIENSDKALSISEKAALANAIKGGAYWLKAMYLLKQGESPLAETKLAIESCEKAYKINPGELVASTNLGLIYWAIGQYQIDKNQPIDKTLSQGLNAVSEAIKISPGSNFGYLLEVRLNLLEAQKLVLEGKSPEDVLDKCYKILQKAIKINPKSSEGYMLLGSISRWRGEWLLKQGKLENNIIQEGLEAIEKSLANNPSGAEAYATKGVLCALASRIEQNSSKSKQLMEDSQKAFQKAFSINKLLQREYQSFVKANG